jgi:hypothetical protein
MDDDRYAELDARVWATHQYVDALKVVVFQTVQLLHRDGHLRIQEVADRAENFAAFAAGAHNKPQSEMIEPLVVALRMLGEELDR